MNIRLEPGKTEYTEEEAARALGVSATQFRSMLLRHVVECEEALGNLPLMRFRPADLVLLSVLGHATTGQNGQGGPFHQATSNRKSRMLLPVGPVTKVSFNREKKP